MSNFVVGLTGGIGSGKTTVSNLFTNLYGITVVDADVIARDVVAPDTQALLRIKEYFGKNVIDEGGFLDRAKLRTLVFESENKKNWLNNLLHPIIRTTMQSKCEQATSEYVILSIPLLTENKLQTMANRVLVVDCSEVTQIKRATSRDGVGEQQIKSIMHFQASRSERLAIADDVIVNEDSEESLSVQIGELHKKYLDFAQNI